MPRTVKKVKTKREYDIFVEQLISGEAVMSARGTLEEAQQLAARRSTRRQETSRAQTCGTLAPGASADPPGAAHVAAPATETNTARVALARRAR
jgi:hypothetical protein